MEDRSIYRKLHHGADLTYFNVTDEQTDLCIGAVRELSQEAMALVRKCRDTLAGWIRGHEEFLTSLEPLDMPAGAPPLVASMYRAAYSAGVGPMAAVAGTVAQAVGAGLLAHSPNVIVENGGDIYLAGDRDRIIGIYAGESSLSNKVGIKIKAEQLPLGICTSSGTVGHSLSFGKADAVMVLSLDAALADAAATAAANRIQTTEDIPGALDFVSGIPGIAGAVAVVGDKMGAWGAVELCRL
jgi:ApbE superfamily uncharacterized protein (UPF0280 family)